MDEEKQLNVVHLTAPSTIPYKNSSKPIYHADPSTNKKYLIIISRQSHTVRLTLKRMNIYFQMIMIKVLYP